MVDPEKKGTGEGGGDERLGNEVAGKEGAEGCCGIAFLSIEFPISNINESEKGKTEDQRKNETAISNDQLNIQ